MRALTRQEVAAAWLYHDKCSALGLGARVFYRQLSSFEKNRVDEMIRDILAADASPCLRRLPAAPPSATSQTVSQEGAVP